jgi:lipoprotein-anchoring transpeptidase ErfK/SrfK
MTLSRRHFLVGLSTLTALPAPALAEQFPIWESDEQLVPYRFRRREVDFKTQEPAGTIVVDAKKRFLYYVLGNGRAIRYGIGVGKEGKRWSGVATVARKAKWPKWTPTAEMQQLIPLYGRYKDGMPGGPDNPLGARALYLLNDGVDNLVRIHGTPGPRTIGRATTSGCFRMLNKDVVELYDKVKVGTRVVVMTH